MSPQIMTVLATTRRFPRVSGDEPVGSELWASRDAFPRVSGDERFPRVSGDEPSRELNRV